jgi:hypothetical protein
MNNYRAEFPRSYRGCKAIEDAKNILNEYGYVSITERSIPKKDMKEFKELVKNCEVIEIEEKTESYTTTPKHTLYRIK